MTGQEENRLSMYLTFKDYQASYTTITDPLPNYKENSVIFLSTVRQIQSFAGQQKVSKKGVTIGKNQLKETLTVMSADYFRKMGVYARFSNNAVLAQEVNISESKIRQAADTAVRDYAQIAYDCAQPIVATLANYGITAATQTQLLAAINAYNDSIGKPGAARTEGGQTTAQLKELFKTADAALANMDAAVEIVRLTHVNFYDGYHKARRIINKGAGSLAVRGMVTDAATGAPLGGAVVTFTLDDGGAKVKSVKDEPDVVKKSAVKGGFNIKSLLAGVYTVTIKKPGYADQVTTITVTDGEMSEFNIQLTKN
ncbi:MAG: carboxypeptidase regulatory-like domain-containing protein [Bacteroidales bacterium]|jgi:hypothetical protein|nr:carboxypeptidase regulatory-like domain-containing protein [Bacteroidales bacterium]